MVLTPSTADHITERFDVEHQARTFAFTERKGVNSVKSVNTFYHSELTPWVYTTGKLGSRVPI